MRDLILHKKITDNLQVKNVNVKEFRNITVMLKMSNFSGKVKFRASLEESEKVDFTIPATTANPYIDIMVVNYNDGTTVKGSEDLVFTNSNDIKIFEANTNVLNSFGVVVTDKTGGDITIDLLATN